MKLWDKGQETDQLLETFTVGLDRELDMYLAPYDILGSLAHIQMLTKVGLLEKDEWKELSNELKDIYKEIEEGLFDIQDGIEDVHSQVEFNLTKRLGDVGKKIHSGRSRNDQVLVDLKLFFVDVIHEIQKETESLFDILQEKSEQHRETLLPGYTHTQVAMPSSFGLWFGAYAESLVEDIYMLAAAYKVVDQNPLGSAAGYGSSFPLDREYTTELLGFSTMAYNVVHAQMGRGKTERLLGYAVASLASTLNKLAADVCLYTSQNFGFISLPDSLTTGSSIMPHKKNPDGFEILRARTNRLQAIPAQIGMITTNLTSGYHRDLQLTKEILLPALQECLECLRMAQYMVKRIRVHEDLLEADMYQYVFSVEVVNELVLKGMSFREAYKQIGKDIKEGSYSPSKTIKHTHAGSIGNPANEEIKKKFQQASLSFSFDRFQQAWRDLLA
ncbi:MAG: argininosuccinate lyase [Bacteroidota bacterium]